MIAGEDWGREIFKLWEIADGNNLEGRERERETCVCLRAVDSWGVWHMIQGWIWVEGWVDDQAGTKVGGDPQKPFFLTTVCLFSKVGSQVHSAISQWEKEDEVKWLMEIGALGLA
jgi:hypothetical protein